MIRFGAGARKLAARERFIGESEAPRGRTPQLVINSARVRVFPGIQSKGLASKMLPLITRRQPHEWLPRYGHRPVGLETFVEIPRRRGTRDAATLSRPGPGR